jgi:hypothetical protein
MKKLVVAVVLSLLAAACANVKFGGTSRWVDAYGPNFPQPNPGQAALYLVRDKASPDDPPINVSLGRQVLGGLNGQTWMLLDLDPKLYDLRAFGTQESTDLIITVDPGQTRFLLVQPTPSGNAEMLELSPAEGRRLVRLGQHIQEMH